MDTEDHKSPFSEWIRSPQTMIALAAVLLSVCGLFVSFYEASLIREHQRASVWPNVEVHPSMNPGVVRIFVQNTGIGPAYIQAAAVTYNGVVQPNWDSMVDSLEFIKKGNKGYVSLINGRVLPPRSEQELIFRIESVPEIQGRGLADAINQAIEDEVIDVVVCSCSVYDECWTTAMLDVIKRAKGKDVPTRDERKVASCSAAKVSGI